MDTKTIDGVAYNAIPEKEEGSCKGCAAFTDTNQDNELCDKLSENITCYSAEVIWVKAETDFKDKLPGVSADMINPSHYKVGGMETIDYLKAKLTPEEFRGYLKGNALKYLSRSNYKHEDPGEDYKKALWYVDRLNRA